MTDHHDALADRGSGIRGPGRLFPQGLGTVESRLASGREGREVAAFVPAAGSPDGGGGGSGVLVDSRFDQRVRWSPGERLD
ncbi:MAG: hypothetical protein QJR09_06415, partial [Micrococcus sp.]|nr:hypothetical protein [Micrococcus sp.]